MQTRLALAFATFASVSASLAAQTVYSPVPLAHHAGMTSTGYPLGYPSIPKMTYQQVHGDLPTSPRLIRHLGWRPIPTSPGHGAFSTTVTLDLGSQGPTPDQATTTYLANLGPNPTRVLSNGQVQLPAYNPQPSAPADYVYTLPFAVPFIYPGTGNLCWLVRVHTHTGTANHSYDMYQQQPTPTLHSGGTGCTASGQTSPLALTGTLSGTNLALTATNIPATGGAALFIGLRNDLFDLTPIGAPCALRTSIVLTVPGISSTSSTNWTATLPSAMPSGVAIYLQAAARDAAANPLGLILSNGLCTLWPYQSRPVVRIWNTGNDTSATGTLQTPYGLVMRLGI